MNRAKRAELAQDTLEIIDSRTYRLPDGRCVDISEAIHSAISGTIHYRPESLADVRSRCGQILAERNYTTKIQVINSTTFAAARTLTMKAVRDATDAKVSNISSTAPYAGVMSLNFASAKNPGGGFLTGAQAQEECLARASALYRCINPVQEYYNVNRDCKTALYTEHMIYSPAVPVFRDDNDALIDDPWCTSIITSPAVNFGALNKNHPELASKTADVMKERIENVLSVAVVNDCRSVVLGAWGCGVFKNAPSDMASWFHEQICGTGKFASAFEHVVFAVLDNTDQRRFIEPFERQFASDI